MSTVAWKRLERLKEDLIELRDADLHPCGFGLVTILGDSGVRLPHPASWKFLERWADFDEHDGNIRLRPDPWFDPAPGGGSCVRWWGDGDRIARFRDWADRVSVVLRKDPDVDVDAEVGPGYHGLLPALVRLAKGDPGLSSRVRTETVLDTATVPKSRQALLPPSLRFLDPPAVFSFEDVHGRAEWFAERVIEWLLRGPFRGPRLVVDVQTGAVTLDGKTCWPGDVFVHILHELIEARGRTINRREMRKNPMLADQERLDRDIDEVRKKLKIQIVSVPRKGYYLPREYLE